MFTVFENENFATHVMLAQPNLIILFLNLNSYKCYWLTVMCPFSKIAKSLHPTQKIYLIWWWPRIFGNRNLRKILAQPPSTETAIKQSLDISKVLPTSVCLIIKKRSLKQWFSLIFGLQFAMLITIYAPVNIMATCILFQAGKSITRAIIFTGA